MSVLGTDAFPNVTLFIKEIKKEKVLLLSLFEMVIGF